MPSSTIVTGPGSLQQNFEENAQELFCNTVFQGGSLATGAGLIWLTPFAAAGAVTLAAGLVAMAHCPAGFSGEALFGTPATFTGGQCNTFYQVFYEFQYANGGPIEANSQTVLGPIYGLEYLDPPGTQQYGLYLIHASQSVPGTKNYLPITFAPPNTWDYWKINNVVRSDGLPDDCGNPPPQAPGAIVSNVSEGDTIDQSQVVNNNDYKLVVPINFNIGGVVGTLNMPFSNPRIQANIPVRFIADVGGIQLSFDYGDDGLKLAPSDELARDKALELIYGRLEDIQLCVCREKVELDMLNLPAIQEVNEECADISVNLLAARGTYPVNIEQIFEQSRVLAEKGCKEELPSVPRTLLFSGTATAEKQVFTSQELSKEIRVIEFEITSFGPDTRIYKAATLDPAQGRYGIIFPGFFDDGGTFYPGPGISQYYESNLVIVPREIISAFGLRVSVPLSTSFNVWDSGLRFNYT